MAVSVEWWVYVVVCVFIFVFVMTVHYIVKKFNEARFEDRIRRLYATTSTSVQVSPPLLDIESKNQLSKYSKEDKKFNKKAEGISLIYTKEQNKAKVCRVLSDNSILKRVKSGKGLRWSPSDDLENKTSKDEETDDDIQTSSTPHLPLACVSSNKDNIHRTTSENIITTKTDILQDLDELQTEEIRQQQEANNDDSVAALGLDLEKEEVESLRNENSRIYNYSNFLGAIYSPKIETHILDNATTSKALSRTELNEISEYEVLTINPVDDKSTYSRATVSTVDKESQKNNSETILLPADIKKSVSFKVRDKDLNEKKNIENITSKTDTGSSEIAVSTSKINNANDHKDEKNTVVKIAKTPDLSSTSKVSFKPESITIYIDSTNDSDSIQSENLENKGTAKHHSNITKSVTEDDNVAANAEISSSSADSAKTSKNNIQLNIACESLNIYKKESSSIKSLKCNNSSYYAVDTDGTLKQSSSNYTENTEETLKPHASSANSEDTQAKKSLSGFKFVDSDADLNCNVLKRLSPDRVRRSASRVTFVDEVVSISTGNICRINSQTNTISRTSPKSDSFERDSRGSFLDEMIFYKYKLDQKLDTWLKEEASTSNRNDNLYFMNQMVLNRLQLGDTRDFECIASESNIKDAKRAQRPVHETVSLDRSDFSSTRSCHEFKKVKDDKSRNSKKRDE